MSTATAPPPAKKPKAAPTASPTPQARPPRRIYNGADWLESLGGVPLERILFDPWPGTATEEDLLRRTASDTLCELIDGTLVEKPVGGFESMVAVRFIVRFSTWADANKAGKVGAPDFTLRVSSGRIRLPDATFFSKDQLPGGQMPKVKVPQVPPTVVVEVVSESNTPAEMQQKLKEYFDSGCRLAWLAYPESRTVAAYDKPGQPAAVFSEQDTLDGGTAMPGFSVPVAELFQDL